MSSISRKIFAGTAGLVTAGAVYKTIQGSGYSTVAKTTFSDRDSDMLMKSHQNYLKTMINPTKPVSNFKQNEKTNQQISENGTIDHTINIPTPSGDLVHISPPISRESQLDRLETEEFDLLVIGGGVSGTATAFEAVSRGLRVALVDKGDFASGTSSKSTKLIHGGVRYLEQAFKEFDFSLIKLVSEALKERTHMIDSATYMNKALPILIPVNTYWELPYIYMGVKMYELFAGSTNNMPPAHILSREETIRRFPNLACESLGVKGSIVYYDGQMNDARHTLALALSAQTEGATVLNYVRVDSLTHANEKVAGAMVTDVLSGRSLSVKARAVVNAAGPFADHIRKMDDPNSPELVVPSAGIHITLPAHVCPPDMGMLIPKTPDGRILFFLPWEGRVIAGTTDSKSYITDLPKADKSDVDFILQIMNGYLKSQLTYDDIKSVWAGLRPLVRDPEVEGTSKLSRDHVVLISDSGLVSLMGGKYTTHRLMGEQTVDAVIKAVGVDSFPLDRNRLTSSNTFRKPVYGQDMASELCFGDVGALHSVLVDVYGLSPSDAYHLTSNYGTNALIIAQNAFKMSQSQVPSQTLSSLLHRAEIDYAVDFEAAVRAEDVLCRRTRLAFLDSQVALDTADDVIAQLGNKLNWSDERKKAERLRVEEVMATMHYKMLDKN